MTADTGVQAHSALPETADPAILAGVSISPLTTAHPPLCHGTSGAGCRQVNELAEPAPVNNKPQPVASPRKTFAGHFALTPETVPPSPGKGA